MLVTDIEITHYRYCPTRARHLANVCMTLKDRIVSMACALDLPADTPNAPRAAAFVQDAIRQLKRMPELRSGQARLEFATGVDGLAMAG